MKKSLTIFFLFFCFTANAQTFKLYQTDNIHNQLKLNTKTGEVIQVQDDGQTFIVKEAVAPTNEKPNRYKLYKTQNIWTYILVDQIYGKLWQCQFSVQGAEYIGSWRINAFELSSTETVKFSIQPLTSMFQFYLINDENGEMWKFQWSTKGEDYRWIEKQ